MLVGFLVFLVIWLFLLAFFFLTEAMYYGFIIYFFG
jgi:hypothetical protein